MPDEREKKEKVLHARIPESLDEEIREHAAQLGLSVSNLVRNVLQNAVGLVDEIIADAGAVVGAEGPRARTAPRRRASRDEASSQETAPPASEPGRVLGWQEAVLNLNAVCDRCNAVLTKGSRGAIAIVEGAGPRPIRCLGCIEEKSHGNDPS